MLINGAAATSLPLDNRGLAYGDGLFETLRIHRGKLLYSQRHLLRLKKGLDRLDISDCITDLEQDLEKVAQALPESGVLKIIVTRGAGGRGYRAAEGAKPDRILTLHGLPPPIDHSGIQAFVCRTRISDNPALAGIKHLNRLEQVMASQEWPGDAFYEGLMLDTCSKVIEGTRSNFFVRIGNRLLTPDLGRSGIEGVLRGVLLEAMPQSEVIEIPLSALHDASEMFFCNSVGGIWPVLSLHLPEGQVISRAPGESCRKARAVFQAAMDAL